MKYWRIIAVSMLLLGIAPAWAAADSSAASDSKPPGSTDTFLQRIDASHEAFSREIDDLSQRLDMFLGGDRTCEISQDSYLQVGASAVLLKSGKVVFDRILRAKIDLPNTQDRFRLLLESDPEKNFREPLSPGARSSTESPTLAEQGPGQNFSAAIQYVTQEKMNWAASLDAGIEAQFPPDPFARGKVKRSYSFGEDWRFTFGETLFWFVSLGPGSSTQFDLEKHIPTSFCQSLFRSSTVATWRYRETGKGFDLSQSLSLYQELSSQAVLAYKFGVTGEAKENTHVNNWGLGVEYRRRVYRDWLYVSVEPAIAFSRDNSFQADPSLRFTIEISFGGKFYK
jgi:hypothetical protein